MIKSIFADQSLAARFIDGDQAHQQLVCGRGLCEGDRLLQDDSARGRINRNIPQPGLFRATLINDREIDALCPLQICSQAPNQNIVLRSYGALDAASSRRRVLANLQAFLGGALKEGFAHHHAQASRARQVAETSGKRDHFAKPVPASVTAEQMLLDGVFLGVCQHAKPIIGEHSRVNGICTVCLEGVISTYSATPMHLRSW